MEPNKRGGVISPDPTFFIVTPTVKRWKTQAVRAGVSVLANHMFGYLREHSLVLGSDAPGELFRPIHDAFLSDRG